MKYITEAEAATQLGLPPHLLSNLRRAKKGPKWFKFGSKAFVTQEDVDEWLAACAQDPTADTDDADEVELPEEGDGDE